MSQLVVDGPKSLDWEGLNLTNKPRDLMYTQSKIFTSLNFTTGILY